MGVLVTNRYIDKGSLPSHQTRQKTQELRDKDSHSLILNDECSVLCIHSVKYIIKIQELD